MSADYLLSLSALHVAAPGVLGVIFGRDGDFEGAPRWCGPIWTGHGHSILDWIDRDIDDPDEIHFRLADWSTPQPLHALALDLRIPTVAARLLRLCSFVELVELVDPNLEPAEIAALTLSLAPRIAALEVSHA